MTEWGVIFRARGVTFQCGSTVKVFIEVLCNQATTVAI